MMLLWLLAIMLAEGSAVTPSKMRPQLVRLASTSNSGQLPVTSARAQDAVPDSSTESMDAVLVDDVVIVLLAWRQTGAFDGDNLMLDLALDLAATDLALDLAATDPALDLAAIDLAWTKTRLASAAIVSRLRGGESRVEEGVNLARLADACMHIAIDPYPYEEYIALDPYPYQESSSGSSRP